MKASIDRRLASALVLMAVTAAGAALAQEPDPQRIAVAQALFDEARALMDASRYQEACPKLEESVRIEPKGLGARLRLAQCYEGARRLSSAFATFMLVAQEAQQAAQPDRAAAASERARALKPRLSRLTLQVSPGVRALAGFELWRDGVRIGEPQWGSPIPVDGGTHRIIARASGKQPFEQRVTVAEEGDLQVVEITALTDVAPAAASSAPLAASAPTAPATSAPAASALTPGVIVTRAPVWPYLVGGVGVLLLAGGLGFRLSEQSIEEDQLALCGGNLRQCARTSPGYDPSGDNARKSRDYGLFVGLTAAGGLLVGGAVIGWLWPRAPQASAVTLAPHPGGITVRGSFLD